MTVFRVADLPESALDAAARFHAFDLPRLRAALDLPTKGAAGAALTLLFPPAPYDHRGWRLAAVQDLAREAAPRRVNAIVGDDEAVIERIRAWLETAPGVTGQLLAADGADGKIAENR